jgi:colicin import membrane protein
MPARFLFQNTWLIAMLIIANYLINTRAIAQNNPSENTQQVMSAEQQERQRIEQERKQVQAEHDAKRVQCYQRLAVTACVNAARDERNTKLSDLKRQEVTLNDLQRKRRAAERVGAMEKQTSPQAQEAQALQRAQAIQGQQQREAEQQRKQKAHQDKLKQASEANPTSSNSPRATLRQPKSAPAPQGKPRAEREAKLRPSQQPGRAEKIAQSQRAADEREQALLKRRQDMQKRMQDQKKPAAAPLPIPQ